MYRRYSDVNQSTVSRPQMRRNRIKNILILVLLAAVITLAVVARPALESRSGARALMIQRMQTEIAEAVRLATSLSRAAIYTPSGSATTSASGRRGPPAG